MNDINYQFGIPYLNDYYIPQGFEINETTGNLFMAYYYKDLSGQNPDSRPSIIIEASPSSGQVIKTLRLLTLSGTNFVYHVGGIGVLGNNLYVSTASHLYRFDLTQTTLVDSGNSGQGPPEYSVRVAEYVSSNVSSYMDIYPDEGAHGALYVGSFSETGYGKVKVYDLPADGSLGNMQFSTQYTLPSVKIQGVVPFNHNGTTELLLSKSYGDHPSTIYLWNPVTDNLKRLACLPAGLEDIDIRYGQVWTWFENGAKYSQKRSSNPWYSLYPYVIAFDLNELISSSVSSECSGY